MGLCCADNKKMRYVPSEMRPAMVNESLDLLHHRMHRFITVCIASSPKRSIERDDALRIPCPRPNCYQHLSVENSYGRRRFLLDLSIPSTRLKHRVAHGRIMGEGASCEDTEGTSHASSSDLYLFIIGKCPWRFVRRAPECLFYIRLDVGE